MLITVPAVSITRAMVAGVRRLCPDLHIVVRAEGLDQLRELHEMGVYEVVQPESEAGLEIARQALLHLDIPATEIQQFVDNIRRELYTPLYGHHADYELLARMSSAQQLMQIHWVPLSSESPLVEHTIGDSRIRSRTGISIVAILRDENLIPNPSPQQDLRDGDLVGVLGDANELARFEQLAQARQKIV